MRIEIIRFPTDEDWLLVRNNALFTLRRGSGIVPDSAMKKKYLASEHSPIRDAMVTANIYEIPYWVSTQFSRHHEGFQSFVSTQRNDIQHEYDRESAPQGAPVNMRISLNAQAIINVSRKRLCNKASKKTTQIWKLFLAELESVFPEIIPFCVPECVYRNGICPEVFNPCGYNKTSLFEQNVARYRLLFQ